MTLTRKHSFDPVYDAQIIYRLLLKAAANPTRIVNIKPYADKLYGEYPALLALAFTLLDSAVGFCVCENPALSDDIACLTRSEAVSAHRADYLFITDPACLEDAIHRAKCGTPEDPHRSATLIIFDPNPASREIQFVGPGIDGTSALPVSDTVRFAVRLRYAQYHEYPRGIDLVFVSGDGDLLVLPRLVRREDA